MNRIVSNDEFFDLMIPMLNSGKTVKMKAKGRSMLPLIRNMYDNVVLKSVKDTSLHINDIVLFRNPISNNYVLHRIIKIQGEKFIIRGDGNAYNKEICTLKDISGYVDEIQRVKGKTKSHIIRRDSTEWRMWIIASHFYRFLLKVYITLVMPIKRRIMTPDK